MSLIVHREASEADIRRAYKKLSKKYHPDKNKDEGAEEKFVEIAHGELLYIPIRLIIILKVTSL